MIGPLLAGIEQGSTRQNCSPATKSNSDLVVDSLIPLLATLQYPVVLARGLSLRSTQDVNDEMRRNSLVEIPHTLPYHIWSSHKIFFSDPPLPPSGINSIVFALDDIGSFRSTVERLPLANKAKIITGIQVVCVLTNAVSSLSLKLSPSIPPLSALTPASWI